MNNLETFFRILKMEEPTDQPKEFFVTVPNGSDKFIVQSRPLSWLITSVTNGVNYLLVELDGKYYLGQEFAEADIQSTGY